MFKKEKVSKKSTYSVGNIIRNARDANKLSIREAAKAIGISAAQFSRMELGASCEAKTGKVTNYKLNQIKDLLKICNLLDIPYEKMLYEVAKDLNIPYMFPFSVKLLTESDDKKNYYGELIKKINSNNLSNEDFKVLLTITESYIECISKRKEKKYMTQEEAILAFAKLNPSVKAVYANNNFYVELPIDFNITKCILPAGWKLIQNEFMGMHIATLEKTE